MMTVRVLLFARARDLAGADELPLALPETATVTDVRRALAEARPALRELLGRCAVAVDGEFACDTTAVTATSTVAVLPPVSGG